MFLLLLHVKIMLLFAHIQIYKISRIALSLSLRKCNALLY